MQSRIELEFYKPVATKLKGNAMRKTLGPAVLAHLDSDKLALLDELSVLTGVPRAVLIREAIDDLIKKHRAVWKKTGPKTSSARNIHQVRLARAARAKMN